MPQIGSPPSTAGERTAGPEAATAGVSDAEAVPISTVSVETSEPISPEIPQAGPPQPAQPAVPSEEPTLAMTSAWETDYLGMINEGIRWVWNTIRSFFNDNRRMFQVIPTQTQQGMAGWVSVILNYLDIADKTTRGIHNVPWFRQTLNGGIDYLVHWDMHKQREAFMVHYACWERGIGDTAWVSIRQKYPTLVIALEKGAVDELQKVSNAWVAERCIAGRCPFKTPLPADVDPRRFSAACCQQYKFRAEVLESNVADFLAPKAVPEVKVPKEARMLMQVIKEKKPGE